MILMILYQNKLDVEGNRWEVAGAYDEYLTEKKKTKEKEKVRNFDD